LGVTENRESTTDDRRPTTDDRSFDTARGRRPTTDRDLSPFVLRPSSIELHIDELILHGFAPIDRAPIAAAIERELGRLLAERGAPPGWAQGADLARLDGGSFDVAPGAGADAVGAQVARAIYNGMGAQRTP
jgi:hypothetical protein